MTSSLRAAMAVCATFVVVMVGVSPAAAHVLLDSAQPDGSGAVTLTFSFDHGCTDSPTNSLTLQVPARSTILTVTQPDGWDSAVKGRTVRWSGPGIPPDDQAKFTVKARLSGNVGQPLLFPTKQGCENGDGYTWDDTSESAERPAPRLVATAAVLDPELSTAPAAVDSGGASAVQVVAFTSAFILLAGVAARLVTRRQPRPPAG